MLHLLLIALAVTLFASDALGSAARVASLSPGAVWLATCAVMLFFALTGGAWIRVCSARLARTGNARLVAHAHQVGAMTRIAAVVAHAFCVLGLGWLDAVRAAMGDWILLDEIVATAPPLLVFIATWFAYAPIDRALWEATLLRTLDEGRSVGVPPSSSLRAALEQFRQHAAIVLVPLSIIWTWNESLIWVANRRAWTLESDASQLAFAGAQFVGVAVAFVITPPLMIRVWRTLPLGPGELRDRLEALCARHRVRCRDILVWRTAGGMLNGAVLGLLPRVRYILFTDALLESLSERQVEAVAAHEIAHIRRRHLPWLLGAIFASLWSGTSLVIWPALGADALLGAPLFTGALSPLVTAAGFVLSLALAVMVFGTVSRAFERQADAFATQSLSGLDTTTDDAPARITEEAAHAMASALQAVAHFNAIPTQRFFWRHGSIRGRQRRVMALVGAPVRSTPADRPVRIIKRITAAALITLACVDGTLLALSALN